ncbi:MAG: hypothetical protein CSA65_05000 [Proteobacteria bacterium]|nr:MAG: hypothetical protein CSB49_03445 [Pseudomonadota bacterium]PIE18473.1 MAG: hypothetical protein CSA65_05000 [Pseudomonadota bacterium]
MTLRLNNATIEGVQEHRHTFRAEPGAELPDAGTGPESNAAGTTDARSYAPYSFLERRIAQLLRQ